jgi:hypothetical protein
VPLAGDPDLAFALGARPGGPGSTARPPVLGPGLAPGNPELTGVQEDPGSIGGGTLERPERYLVVARLAGDEAGGGDARAYLFARWPDWPHPAMLALWPPGGEETLAEAVGRLLHARMNLRLRGEPRLASRRIPARMRHPRTGVEGLGWLRPLAAEAAGEPSPDALLEAVELHAYAEALRALPSDVERTVFREGAALLE